jgi:hypothetical protein
MVPRAMLDTEQVESAVEQCLSSEDLLCLVLRGAQGRRLQLAQALRYRQVARVWASAVSLHMRRARALALGGCTVKVLQHPPAGLCLGTLTELDCELALTHPNSPPDLSSLPPALHSCSLSGLALSDEALASALGSLHMRCRLRSLALRGCTGAAHSTLQVLQERHAASLTSLDLSGCRAAMRLPMRLESALRACTELEILSLSSTALSSAALAAVLTHATGLLSLHLDSCSLEEDEALCDELVAPLWRRMRRLRVLSLSDNPRLLARAVARIVDSLPALVHLNLGANDFWPSETGALLNALTASTSLRKVGALDCEQWLTPEILDRLHACHVVVDHDPSKLPYAAAAQPAALRPATPEALEDWEALDLTEAAMPEALRIGSPSEVSAPEEASATRAALQRFQAIDYSRPPQYRQRPRSIYHISTGDQPYYGSGDAAGTSAPSYAQTDVHGLRS